MSGGCVKVRKVLWFLLFILTIPFVIIAGGLLSMFICFYPFSIPMMHLIYGRRLSLGEFMDMGDSSDLH